VCDNYYACVIDCRSFASGICGKLSEMLDRTSVPLDVKMKLMSIFEHMRFDPDNYEKVCFEIFVRLLLQAVHLYFFAVSSLLPNGTSCYMHLF